MAKRKHTNEPWSDWTMVDDYDEAVKTYERIKELGFDAKMIDRREKK